ncbi:vascular cell adhesion protein 1-like [Aplochiton taeniatus]
MVSSTLNVTFSRKDSGSKITCEARLDLGQTDKTWTTEPLNITVHYMPIINSTKLPRRIPVFRGYPEELVCEAEGHPPPKIEWRYGTDKFVRVHGGNLTVFEAGIYACTASNYLANSSIEVEVVLKGSPVLANCPLELSPSSVVVRYGDPVSVNCSTSTSHDGMGWEATKGSTGLVEGGNEVKWKVSSLEDWTISPKCYINPTAFPQCFVNLPVTLYKPPDDVSISLLDNTSTVREGTKYQLQCKVINVAPVQKLTVTWFKGNELIKLDHYNSLTRTPVNQSFTLTVTPSRYEAQFKCVAQLNLDSEPITSPMADDLNMNVLWTYNCTASNNLGSKTKQFIVKSAGNRWTFWAIIGSFLALAVLILSGYVVIKMKSGSDSII